MKNIKDKIKDNLIEIFLTLFFGGFFHIFYICWISFPVVQADVINLKENDETIKTVLCEMAINQYRDNQKILRACK
jgi:hypothetical protein